MREALLHIDSTEGLVTEILIYAIKNTTDMKVAGLLHNIVVTYNISHIIIEYCNDLHTVTHILSHVKLHNTLLYYKISLMF